MRTKARRAVLIVFAIMMTINTGPAVAQYMAASPPEVFVEWPYGTPWNEVSGTVQVFNLSPTAEILMSGGCSDPFIYLDPPTVVIQPNSHVDIDIYRLYWPGNGLHSYVVDFIDDFNPYNHASTVFYINGSGGPGPALSVAPPELYMEWHSGEPAPVGQIQVFNTGTNPSTVNWEGTVDGPLFLSPSTGSVAAGGHQNIAVHVSDWPGPGMQSYTATFTDPNSYPSTGEVTVFLNCVEDLAQLAAEPPEIYMEWQYGNPAPTGFIQVFNTGLGTTMLNWSGTVDPPLSLSPAGGSVPGGGYQDVNVIVNEWPGNGLYEYAITFNDPNANPPSDVVTAFLNCTNEPVPILAVEPPEIYLEWYEGTPPPSGQLLVFNMQPQPSYLEWTGTAPPPLLLNPSAGVVFSMEFQAVQILMYDWPGPGLHQLPVTISSPNADPPEDETIVYLNCMAQEFDLIMTSLGGDPLILNPPYGCGFPFTVQGHNGFLDAVEVDFWVKIQRPDGVFLSANLHQHHASLQPGESTPVYTLEQYVPPAWWRGTYHVHGYAGILAQQEIWDTESFAVVMNGWSRSVSDTDGSYFEPEQLPDEFRVQPAYPNPFNAAATIQIDLPETASLSVEVFNTAGRQVAMLASGSYPAGRHMLTFDGSMCASGLYFIQTTVPGQIDNVQKVMLVR